MKEKIAQFCIYAGLITVAAGCFIPLLTGPQALAYKIVFSIGAVLVLAGRLLARNNAPGLRSRRLVRMQVWVGLFFCVGAFFLWYSRNPQDWLAFTLAGALIQCFVSISLPRALKKGN